MRVMSKTISGIQARLSYGHAYSIEKAAFKECVGRQLNGAGAEEIVMDVLSGVSQKHISMSGPIACNWSILWDVREEYADSFRL